MFLAVIFPKSQCNNLAYNRSVKFPKNYKSKNFVKDLSHFYDIKIAKKPIKNKFQIYFKGELMSLNLKPNFKTLGADCLDFGEFVLKEILNIKDETNDQKVDFVSPSLGDNDINDISTFMRPVKIDLVMKYAKKGKFMPPKATWFEPKPLDGIFFHHI